MQKETVIIIVAVAAITGWMYRDTLMNKVNPPPQQVNTADMAPAGSRYSQDSADAPVSKNGIYSWKDKDGNTHFGNRDVADNAESVTLSKGNTVHLSGEGSRSHAGQPQKATDTKPAVKPITHPDRVRQKLNSAAEQQQQQVKLMTETMQ